MAKNDSILEIQKGKKASEGRAPLGSLVGNPQKREGGKGSWSLKS